MAPLSQSGTSSFAAPRARLLVLALLAFLVLIAVAALFWLYRQHAMRQRVSETVARAVEQRDLLQKPSEAVTLLKEALKEDPDSWSALLELGRTYLGLDKAHDAITVLEQALLRAPDAQRPGIQLALGNAYRMRFQGSGSDADYQMALASFDEARAQPELEAEALMHCGMLALRARKFKEAQSYFELLLQRHPDYENREQVEKGLKLAQEVGR